MNTWEPALTSSIDRYETVSFNWQLSSRDWPALNRLTQPKHLEQLRDHAGLVQQGPYLSRPLHLHSEILRQLAENFRFDNWHIHKKRIHELGARRCHEHVIDLGSGSYSAGCRRVHKCAPVGSALPKTDLERCIAQRLVPHKPGLLESIQTIQQPEADLLQTRSSE